MITTTIKSFESMTLKEIYHLKNNDLVQKYLEIISQLKTDKLGKEIVESSYGEPVNDILEAIEESKIEFMSTDLFPNKPIKVYPGIREVHAKEDYTCDFSGAKISKGSIYINYRPMLKNLSNGDTYVLKRTIKTELAYEHDLPTNIGELESFINKIRNYENYDNEEIQYDYLNGQGGLQFKKLSRRKNNENRNN